MIRRRNIEISFTGDIGVEIESLIATTREHLWMEAKYLAVLNF